MQADKTGLQIYVTACEGETEAMGQSLAETLAGGEVLAMRGGLGAGKTAFIRGLGRGLEVRDPVCSPTFAILNLYRGGRLLLAHFDMYRVSDQESLESTGFYDLLDDGAAVMAVEWSENIDWALPEDAIVVRFEVTGEHDRKITIERGAGRI